MNCSWILGNVSSPCSYEFKKQPPRALILLRKACFWPALPDAAFNFYVSRCCAIQSKAVGTLPLAGKSWQAETGFSSDWKKCEFTLFRNYYYKKLSCRLRANGRGGWGGGRNGKLKALRPQETGEPGRGRILLRCLLCGPHMVAFDLESKAVHMMNSSTQTSRPEMAVEASGAPTKEKEWGGGGETGRRQSAFGLTDSLRGRLANGLNRSLGLQSRFAFCFN